MSVGFQHPAVKTHIGDGFKFLEDRKDEFDVIITDSSDPEGPAEALFQKPYYQLLYNALREGGVITTQGCMPSFFLASPILSSFFPVVTAIALHMSTCSRTRTDEMTIQRKTNGYTLPLSRL